MTQSKQTEVPCRGRLRRILPDASSPYSLWLRLLAGGLCSGLALVSLRVGSWWSLGLMPHAYILSAVPDGVVSWVFNPVEELLQMGLPGKVHGLVMHFLFMVLILSLFPLYTLILWLASGGQWLRKVALSLLLFHLMLMGLAGYLQAAGKCSGKAEEGRHAREAQELYGH